MTDAPTPASTTHRVAEVLLALGRGDEWKGVSSLARDLALGKAVVHRILQTLAGSGLVKYDAQRRQYALGPAAHALAAVESRRDRLLRAGSPAIAHLGQLTGETTTLVERVGHERIYIDQVESSQHIRISIRVGDTYPLAHGASGQSILAFLPPDDIDLALSVPVRRYTPTTVVDVAEIRARLALIRERGWATTTSERVAHSASIAAPVLDPSGHPLGSLSVAYLASRFAAVEVPRIAELVMAASRHVERRLAADTAPAGQAPAVASSIVAAESR